MTGHPMQEAINFFNAVNYLEPKCPRCLAKIEYDVTTRYDEAKKAHVCKNCGVVLK